MAEAKEKPNYRRNYQSIMSSQLVKHAIERGKCGGVWAAHVCSEAII